MAAHFPTQERSARFAALSLVVEDGNRSVHLYGRAGFVRFSRDEEEGDWTMRLDLGVAS